MIAYLQQFAAERGLECKVDEVGNVLVRKPATPGMEDRKAVILQSHMDMVCEKNRDVDFDFTKDAIRTEVDGEWLRAQGTTLGADDGIGIAMALAVLDADDMAHGPLECVFTRDEETGLTGAFGMKPGFMSGDMLLNLDSEDEGQLFVSCAGRAATTAEFDFKPIGAPQDYFFFELKVKGLTGGHSGDDINKKRANANKLLVRFLYNALAKYDLYLCDIQAGGLHNAIPREAMAVCAIPMADKGEYPRGLEPVCRRRGRGIPRDGKDDGLRTAERGAARGGRGARGGTQARVEPDGRAQRHLGHVAGH